MIYLSLAISFTLPPIACEFVRFYIFWFFAWWLFVFLIGFFLDWDFNNFSVTLFCLCWWFRFGFWWKEGWCFLLLFFLYPFWLVFLQLFLYFGLLSTCWLLVLWKILAHRLFVIWWVIDWFLVFDGRRMVRCLAFINDKLLEKLQLFSPASYEMPDFFELQ